MPSLQVITAKDQGYRTPGDELGDAVKGVSSAYDYYKPGGAQERINRALNSNIDVQQSQAAQNNQQAEMQKILNQYLPPSELARISNSLRQGGLTQAQTAETAARVPGVATESAEKGYHFGREQGANEAMGQAAAEAVDASQKPGAALNNPYIPTTSPDTLKKIGMNAPEKVNDAIAQNVGTNVAMSGQPAPLRVPTLQGPAGDKRPLPNMYQGAEGKPAFLPGMITPDDPLAKLGTERYGKNWIGKTYAEVADEIKNLESAPTKPFGTGPQIQSPEQRQSVRKEVQTNYEQLPSTRTLFGSGQMPGIDRFKSIVDQHLQSVGGDWSKMNPQQRSSLVYADAKANDPNVQVTMENFKMVAARAGIAEKGLQYVEKFLQGQPITEGQAKDVYDTVSNIYNASVKQQMTDLYGMEKRGMDLNQIAMPEELRQAYNQYKPQIEESAKSGKNKFASVFAGDKTKKPSDAASEAASSQKSNSVPEVTGPEDPAFKSVPVGGTFIYNGKTMTKTSD